jgi:hypothetical protein
VPFTGYVPLPLLDLQSRKSAHHISQTPQAFKLAAVATRSLMCCKMFIVSSLLAQQCLEKVVLRVQGLKASLLGAIPYSAVRLGSYDGLKWAYRKVRPTSCPLI